MKAQGRVSAVIETQDLADSPVYRSLDHTSELGAVTKDVRESTEISVSLAVHKQLDERYERIQDQVGEYLTYVEVYRGIPESAWHD